MVVVYLHVCMQPCIQKTGDFLFSFCCSRTRATGLVAWTLVCHPRGEVGYGNSQPLLCPRERANSKSLPIQLQDPTIKTTLRQRACLFQPLNQIQSGDVVRAKQEDLWTHVPRDQGVPDVVYFWSSNCCCCCRMGREELIKICVPPRCLTWLVGNRPWMSRCIFLLKVGESF